MSPSKNEEQWEGSENRSVEIAVSDLVSDQWEFTNDFFRRGERTLLTEIRRRKSSTTHALTAHSTMKSKPPCSNSNVDNGAATAASTSSHFVSNYIINASPEAIMQEIRLFEGREVDNEGGNDGGEEDGEERLKLFGVWLNRSYEKRVRRSGCQRQ
ncbi:Heat stress transcription factor B-4 [Acorus calamus]|uniref:Heat stress transcription factor B-4 n=1 Tax=Acorus calamus TaxID=4465 RepID=A0AAV9EXW0_ACOCL|nr:Heat stress transcription factor B-4 [Acorus calamus]